MVDEIETITLDSVKEITDNDFNNPTRSIGYALDALAAAYVDKFGGDEKEVA